MSWLRKRAEEAARKTYPSDTYDREVAPGQSQGDALALRLETLARRFAGRAVAQTQVHIAPQKPNQREWEAALEAADKDET